MLVYIYNEITAVNSYKNHGTVTIGVSPETAIDLMQFNHSDKKAILIIVDLNVYNKLNK